MAAHLPPCKDCEIRHPGCHARCSDYGRWKIAHEEELEALRDERNMSLDYVRRRFYYFKYNKK